MRVPQHDEESDSVLAHSAHCLFHSCFTIHSWFDYFQSIDGRRDGRNGCVCLFVQSVWPPFWFHWFGKFDKTIGFTEEAEAEEVEKKNNTKITIEIYGEEKGDICLEMMINSTRRSIWFLQCCSKPIFASRNYTQANIPNTKIYTIPMRSFEISIAGQSNL